MSVQSQKPMGILITNIRAAYQLSKGEVKDGIAASLLTLKRQMELYRKMGVSPDQLELHAVFHSNAGQFLLADEAFNGFTQATGGNPNQEIIRELQDSGVKFELCFQTMQRHQWAATDLLADVTVVESALTRLVDLQLQGFAYVKL